MFKSETRRSRARRSGSLRQLMVERMENMLRKLKMARAVTPSSPGLHQIRVDLRRRWLQSTT